MPTKKYVVFDRDGTLIHERHYLSDPEQIELIPGIAVGLRLLAELGFGLIIVTNQSGIGRGYFSEHKLAEIHARLIQLLADEQISLWTVFFIALTLRRMDVIVANQDLECYYRQLSVFNSTQLSVLLWVINLATST